MLGSTSFTPFMQLHLGARREIIEDLLDISIFSSMNQVLKGKYVQLENQQRVIEGEIEVAKQKAKVQEEYILTLETDKQAKVDDILKQLKEEKNAVQTNQETANDLHEEKEALGDVTSTKAQLDKYRDRFQRQIEQHEKALAFFENNDECPTCQQGIPHEHKDELSSKDKDKINEIQTALEELEKKYTEVNALCNKVIEIDEKIMDANNEIITHQRIVQRLQLELNDTETKVGNITEEKAKLKKLAKTTLSKVEDKTDLTQEEHYYNVARAMLKDSGIKTKIIKEYLPIINKLVNKYLQAMDFFVQFDLDETFKETIKSRHRDKFSYASFSEGEKQRIDLALVFTWRTIAKMKNSASTNILLLDEVFDSSLDVNGTDYVMTLLNTIGEDTNVFVISHKGDQLFDKFRSVIRFEKRQNYSVLENRKQENDFEQGK
jgi:DNA repair exonuclease SbcCD ATPase subunit